jgi:hypothetical protein
MYGRSGRGKYGAVRTEYGGRTYASKLEARCAAELDLMLKAKAIRSWEPQVAVDLAVNGIKVCRYVVDFRAVHLDGSVEWIEAKGIWTAAARIKAKLFKAAYLATKPGERYTVWT